MFALALILLDGPMALYLGWVACTLAVLAIGVLWVFRPALAVQPLKRLGIVWGVVTVLLIVVTVHIFGNRTPSSKLPEAPNFALRTIDGQSFTRANLRGKVVLIEFWASWCGPCREALPKMIRLHHEFRNSRFVMIGISEDENQSKFEAFVAKHGMRWPQDWDPKGELLARFSSDAIPSYAVIDAQGRLRFLQKGYNAATYARLREAIGDALGNRVASLQP